MVQLKSDAGIYMGMADFVFTLNALGSEHSVIELSFNAGFMGLDKITDITWAPGCGNDQAMLQLTKLSRTVNPEPASLLIWGGIGIGTAFVTWRKRKALAPAK